MHICGLLWKLEVGRLRVVQELEICSETSFSRISHERQCSLPSVRFGIQGSTEYGKLSTNAHNPRIAECNVRIFAA